jgi:hypothetical protein
MTAPSRRPARLGYDRARVLFKTYPPPPLAAAWSFISCATAAAHLGDQ